MPSFPSRMLVHSHSTTRRGCKSAARLAHRSQRFSGKGTLSVTNNTAGSIAVQAVCVAFAWHCRAGQCDYRWQRGTTEQLYPVGSFKLCLQLLSPGCQHSVALCQLVQGLKPGAVVAKEYLTSPSRCYIPADTNDRYATYTKVSLGLLDGLFESCMASQCILFSSCLDGARMGQSGMLTWVLLQVTGVQTCVVTQVVKMECLRHHELCVTWWRDLAALPVA